MGSLCLFSKTDFEMLKRMERLECIHGVYFDPENGEAIKMNSETQQQKKLFDLLQKYVEKGSFLMARPIKIQGKGLLVELPQPGVLAYLPISQIEKRFVQDMTPYLQRPIQVRIVKFTDGRLTVSRSMNDEEWCSQVYFRMENSDRQEYKEVSDLLRKGESLDGVILSPEGEIVEFDQKTLLKGMLWELLSETKDQKDRVQLEFIRRVKQGTIVKILEIGLLGFVPDSQLDIGWVPSPEVFTHHTFSAFIIDLNASKGDIIVSRRAFLESIMEPFLGQSVPVRVIQRVKGGVFVDFHGTPLFLWENSLRAFKNVMAADLLQKNEWFPLKIKRTSKNKIIAKAELQEFWTNMQKRTDWTQILNNTWQKLSNRFTPKTAITVCITGWNENNIQVITKDGIQGIICKKDLSMKLIESGIERFKTLNVRFRNIDCNSYRIFFECCPLPLLNAQESKLNQSKEIRKADKEGIFSGEEFSKASRVIDWFRQWYGKESENETKSSLKSGIENINSANHSF